MITFNNSSVTAKVVTTGMVSALALSASTDAAFAQGLDGFYAGASVGLLNGDGMVTDDWDDTTPDEYSFDNAMNSGVFVGYQRDLRNGMFAGFELAMNFGGEMDAFDVSEDELFTDGVYTVSKILDYKFRLGTKLGDAPALGPVSVYGFAGITTGSASRYYAWDYDFSGYNYGIGAEKAIGEDFSIGLEVMGRSLDVYAGDGPRQASNSSQVTLRSSFHF